MYALRTWCLAVGSANGIDIDCYTNISAVSSLTSLRIVVQRRLQLCSGHMILSERITTGPLVGRIGHCCGSAFVSASIRQSQSHLLIQKSVQHNARSAIGATRMFRDLSDFSSELLCVYPTAGLVAVNNVAFATKSYYDRGHGLRFTSARSRLDTLEL
ncbi:hypothetical protein K488DRAFT_72252 [Vararia minispora EC-137]|uniref:Uncharacterized protein n=1 Tax=Vararia minispora EC-137 TaxID=1314806 RepID=A0ACB8QF15_9AGAM|nr:hypothetical protein K488DRAFT_72252 [Vararia minispora EC-137]